MLKLDRFLVVSCELSGHHIKFDIAQQGLGGQALESAMLCRLPANASATKKRIAAFLKQRLRMPDVALVVLFNVRPWAWTLLAAWLVGAPLASRMEVRDARYLESCRRMLARLCVPPLHGIMT